MRYELGPRLPEDEASQTESGTEQGASDQALMQRVRDGSRTSLGVLMQRYWSPLVAYACPAPCQTIWRRPTSTWSTGTGATRRGGGQPVGAGRRPC